MYDNPWALNGAIFTSDMIGDYIGFVYEITNTIDNKCYIGKKNFFSTVKLPPLKGKTKKRKKTNESNWMEYYGSNEEVNLLVEQQGKSTFNRKILKLCESKGIMSYWEAKLQFEKNVLLSDDYYNKFIGCKIHSNHVKELRKLYE